MEKFTPCGAVTACSSDSIGKQFYKPNRFVTVNKKIKKRRKKCMEEKKLAIGYCVSKNAVCSKVKCMCGNGRQTKKEEQIQKGTVDLGRKW